MSMNIAVVIGPFIALTLLQFITFQQLFVVLTVIAIGGILFTFFIKVVENAPTKVASAPSKRKITWYDLIERKALLFALIGSLVAFSYSSVISFISIYAKKLDLLEFASYFFIAFAVAMLISRPFAGRLFDMKGPTVVIVPSFLLFCTGLFTLSMVNSPVVFLLSGMFIGLGYGTLVPCLQTLAVQSCERERSSHAIATFFTLFDTGLAVGSYLLGMVASRFGYSHLYLSIAIFLLLPLYIFIQFVSRKRTTYRVGANVESY